MPQISLYIDEDTLKKVENAARRRHISISKWVAEQIRTKVEPVYPEGFETLFGSIKDSTFQRPPQLRFDHETSRESL